MATVTEQATEKVKEKLVGKEEDAQQPLPEQARVEFARYAVKDEESGEQYMGQKEFVDAIAPVGEDYVSLFSYMPDFALPNCTCTCTFTALHNLLCLPT